MIRQALQSAWNTILCSKYKNYMRLGIDHVDRNWQRYYNNLPILFQQNGITVYIDKCPYNDPDHCDPEVIISGLTKDEVKLIDGYTFGT